MDAPDKNHNFHKPDGAKRVVHSYYNIESGQGSNVDDSAAYPAVRGMCVSLVLP